MVEIVRPKPLVDDALPKTQNSPGYGGSHPSLDIAMYAERQF